MNKTFALALVLAAGCTSSNNDAPFCGDGFVDPHEQCDDGNSLGGDGCSASCLVEIPPAVCGDHHVDVGEECDDGNTQSGDGCSSTCGMEGVGGPYLLHANWALKTVAGATQACPGGFDTAAVSSQKVDPITLDPIGSPVIDLFDCADGTGTTNPLAAADYVVTIGITNTSGSSTFETSTAAEVDSRSSDKTLSVSLYSDGGYFSFAWHLTRMSNGDPLTCAQANSTGVESVSTSVTSSTNAVDDIFDCASGEGITAVLVAGTYTVSIDAIDSTMGAIGTASPIANAQIMAPNKVTDLGSVAIPIDSL